MPGPQVASIGFFDGVHLGHRCLIGQVTEEAQRRGWPSLLVTFDRHPACVLRPEAAPALLTTDAERLRLLRGCGVDDVQVLPFTSELSQLTAEAFMRDVLLGRFGVRCLVVGYDHHFGHGRGEGFADYRRMGRLVGIDVVQAIPLERSGPDTPVASSSAIRRALRAGAVEEATALLGRPYALRGRVVDGFHVGRQLGYPTANIRPDSPEKVVPGAGVYAVEVSRPEGRGGTSLRGMLYIGSRPTFVDDGAQSIEVHLFDFHADIYAEVIEVRFLRYIRPGRTFASAEALREQLKRDEEACR